MKKGRPGPDTMWVKLSPYQAFLYAQQGLLVSSRQKRGRFLVLKPFKPREQIRSNGAAHVPKNSGPRRW
jgi:hypothetical protein